MEQTLTPEEIQGHYNAALDSVDLINGIISGTQMAEASGEEKKACVERNVAHLEIMVAKDYWTTQDMKPLNDAIAAGKAYV